MKRLELANLSSSVVAAQGWWEGDQGAGFFLGR